MSEQEMEMHMDERAGEGNWELYSVGEYTRTYYDLNNGDKVTFERDD